MKDEDSYVRYRAAKALGSVFSQVVDKEQATKDLLALTKDADRDVLWTVAKVLGSVFAHVTDREEVWKVLLALTKRRTIPDEYGSVREMAAEAIGLAFCHVADKEQATKDLLVLTKDEDKYVRGGAAKALGSAFIQVTDKEQATKDLLSLTKDEDGDVRTKAAEALGSAFSQVTDKEQATEDLLALTKDEHSYVREGAAKALGSAFSHITDKEQATKDLLALTKDEDSEVNWTAEGALGKAYIFKATVAKDNENLIKELEIALEFFKKSYYRDEYFCLPFYRALYTIIFKKEEALAEVQSYITKARNAAKGSENKEKLVEAVENLSNALKDVQKSWNFDEIKHDLDTYQRYCDRAAELLNATEDKAPEATKLVRRGLQIIDERIKEILSEFAGYSKSHSPDIIQKR